MKPIQISGITMSRMTMRANEAAVTRPNAAQESFSVRWNREVCAPPTNDRPNSFRPPAAQDDGSVLQHNAVPQERSISAKMRTGQQIIAVESANPPRRTTRPVAVIAGPEAGASLAVPAWRLNGPKVPTNGNRTKKIGDIRAQNSSIGEQAKVNAHHGAASLPALVSQPLPPGNQVYRGQQVGELKSQASQKSMPSTFGSPERRPELQNRAAAQDKPVTLVHRGDASAPPEGKGIAWAHSAPSESVEKQTCNAVAAEAPSISAAGLGVAPVTPQHARVLSFDASQVRGQLSLTGANPAVNSHVAQTVLGTPASLDVGVFNGTHGWLRVRAELGTAGTVNASVIVIGSAHEALRAAVPEIASYLGGEAVKVDSIAVHRFLEEPASTSTSTAQGRQSGGQQNDEDREYATREGKQGVPVVERTDAGDALLESSDGLATGPTGLLDNGVLNILPSVAWTWGSTSPGIWLNVSA